MDINEIESFTSIEDGIEVTYQIIMNFDCEETGKHYLVYTDNEENEEGDINVFVSTFDPEAEHLDLEEVVDEEEMEFVTQVLEQTLNNDNITPEQM